MIDRIPLWLIGPGVFLAMVLACWLGHSLKQRLGSDDAGAGNNNPTNGYVISGVFGLLALLMAFSFSLAINRFENRRELVIAEANAIGTFDSRLALRPEPVRGGLSRDLRHYGELRLAWGRASDASAAARSVDESSRLLDSIGRRMFAALAREGSDTRLPLLVQSLNDVGDLASARHAERDAHLPSTVIVLLALFCLAGAMVFGHTLEGRRRHAAASYALLFALLTCSFVTIIDLDRPRGGSILVPQSELERAVRDIAP